MSGPFVATASMDAAAFAKLRRRAIFECCKWDPQVEDVCTIADAPLILTAEAWRELSALAERLANELMAAEDEIASRPELHGDLGLPRAVVKALKAAARRPARGIARLARFDFHATDDGWRISEVNSDVPGGLNEASGLGAMMAGLYPHVRVTGDPASAYVRALASASGDGCVALVHATSYTDDRQVMTFLSRSLERIGIRAVLAGPLHLRWRDGVACVDCDWYSGPVKAIVRFFPGEWLPNLPARCQWQQFFEGAVTPVSNPATAILTQTKRFPLVWNRLRAPMVTWRELLPETRDPRTVDADDDWVLKPALGRVGEGVTMRGVSSPVDWQKTQKAVRRTPHEWVAQRRFNATPFVVGRRPLFPTIGVYTVDGVVAGAYGRVAERPLIDATARDAAVLVESASPVPAYPGSVVRPIGVHREGVLS